MDQTLADRKNTTAAETTYDMVVIGAGVSGIYQLFRLRETGMRIRVFEAGEGVGGVWYWNRYPGARLDTESYLYTNMFPRSVVGDWHWSEHFAGQAELERYFNFVVDRMDLRRHIEFNTKVEAAHFDEARGVWDITLHDGRKVTSTFFVPAVGQLSAAVLPNLPGIEKFKGELHHTARWPKRTISFEGKRVGVIGTAASGVQVIQDVAAKCRSLTVFQRTPNWCTPLNNSKIDDMSDIWARSDEMFARTRKSDAWSFHNADPRKTLDTSTEDRNAFFEKLYRTPGLGVSHGNFSDIYLNREANETISEFVRRKIAERVSDPETARKLQPTDHGFGTRRIPLESGYYEIYNRDNVDLVDVKADPIVDFSANEVITRDNRYEIDILVCATGFSPITGAYDLIDIRGRNGVRLKDYWSDGPRTLVGIMVEGFPNMLMPAGPHTALGNISNASAYTIDWAARLIGFMSEHGYRTAEPTAEAAEEWNAHVMETSTDALANEVDSWQTGVNSNLSGKRKRFVGLYRGGAVTYRQRCEQIAASGYAAIDFDRKPE